MRRAVDELGERPAVGVRGCVVVDREDVVVRALPSPAQPGSVVRRAGDDTTPVPEHAVERAAHHPCVAVTWVERAAIKEKVGPRRGGGGRTRQTIRRRHGYDRARPARAIQFARRIRPARAGRKQQRAYT